MRKRGSDFQGRLCPVVRSWELTAFFYYRREINVSISLGRCCSLWVVGENQLIPDSLARDFFPIRGNFFLT